MPASSNWFRRLALPGLAFKAVVIGGGYVLIPIYLLPLMAYSV